MARLTAAKRNALPASDFAIPSERKYPINDAAHRANAKARAAGQANKGAISGATKRKIDVRAGGLASALGEEAARRR